jgi:hypothetical protein
MSETLELKITVKAPSDVGNKVRQLVIDGERSCEGIFLASDGYTIDVVKLERADGLPLAIDEDFQDWFNHSGIQSSHRSILYKAYCAGRTAV